MLMGRQELRMLCIFLWNRERQGIGCRLVDHQEDLAVLLFHRDKGPLVDPVLAGREQQNAPPLRRF